MAKCGQKSRDVCIKSSCRILPRYELNRELNIMFNINVIVDDLICTSSVICYRLLIYGLIIPKRFPGHQVS